MVWILTEGRFDGHSNDRSVLSRGRSVSRSAQLERYFLADQTSIRYFDEAKNAVSLVAGADEHDTADGIGSDARFSEIDSLLVTSDGRTLWCADSAVRG